MPRESSTSSEYCSNERTTQPVVEAQLSTTSRSVVYPIPVRSVSLSRSPPSSAIDRSVC